MKRKVMLLVIILLFVVSSLPPMFTLASTKYEKTGHITATFTTIYGHKNLKVSVDWKIWIPYGDESWNTSWPFKYWYRITSTCGDETQTYEDTDDFAGFEQSSIQVPVVDCEYNGDGSPSIEDSFGEGYLYVDMAPFWGGSDPGFRIWAKSFWKNIKVYFGVDESISVSAFSNLVLQGLNLPKSNDYSSHITFSVITADGKNYYISTSDDYHYNFGYSYYNSYDDQGDLIYQGKMFSDGKSIYTAILPIDKYRKDYDTVGYVFAKSLSRSDYVRFPYDGRMFLPYDDMKKYITDVLYGKLGAKYGDIKVIKKGNWQKYDDSTYTRLVMVEYPKMPPYSPFVRTAYEYYYAWDKYTPSLMKFYVVGIQAKEIYEDNGKTKESVKDYYDSVWGGDYDDILDKALSPSSVYYDIDEFLNTLPSVDRVLFGDSQYHPLAGDLLHLRYASRAFRMKWLADWFYDAALNEEKASDLPGHAYLEVKLGDVHIKAIRDGKDVSKKVDVPAQVVNGRMLVPVRHISEPLGAQVGWDGKERKVTIALNGHTIEMWIDNPVGRVDGKEYTMPSRIPPMIINNRTMVPLRFVAEALGAEVEWNFQTKTAIIKYLPDRQP